MFNRISPTPCYAAWLVLLVPFTLSLAEAEEGAEPEQYELEMGDYMDSVGQELAILDLDDVEITGNPLQGLFAKWPEDLVIAPVPGYSPQLGWNLMLVGGYFIGPDEDADHAASVLGGFAYVSDNGSRAYGGGANLHLLDDKLRVQVGALHADIRYDYYINDIGGSGRDVVIPIRQDGPAYFASGSWRIWKKLYVGVGYLTAELDTELRGSPLEIPPELIPDLAIRMAAITLPVLVDSRDNEQFPRSGWKVEGRTALYRESVGSDFDAETYKISANNYRPMREHDVLATRIIVRGTSTGVPFYLLSTLGGSTDLRGYPSGRYRDRFMYALQSEYRWQFNDKWIFTGFAGFGEVAEEFSEFGKDILPAAGIGVRRVLSQKHKVSLSADIAVGSDGTEFYFGVGEAF